MQDIPLKKTYQIDHAKAGSVVRHQRLKAKLSLRSLAEQLNVSAPFLSDMERGFRCWSEERFNLAIKIIKQLKP
jgi:predicted transcriptional regulator